MKLPAYGHALLKARRAGVHPAVVHVIYGFDWRVDEGAVRLAVKPGEAAGLDWRCVAGLPVEFHDRSPAPLADEALAVIGEIGRESAHLAIVTPEGRRFADDLAFSQRRLDGQNARCDWPAWWSGEIEKINGQNRKRWIEEATHYLARLCA